MMSRIAAPGWLLILALAACAPPLGAVRVAVIFENESRTQCIKASVRNASGASVNANPASLPRDGKDSLVIGLSETAELLGELRVTIARFSSADCSGTAFGSETKVISLVHGGPTAMLEFRYTGESSDGGVDGGVDAGAQDSGIDAGCNTSACANAPGDCEQGAALGCGGDGGCRFAFKAMQTSCGDGGVCNSMGSCLSNVCAVVAPGTTCNDQLPCTLTSSCQAGACQGQCAVPPQCKALTQPLSCDAVTSSVCAMRADADFTNCTLVNGGRCFDGGCLPWLGFTPLNFPTTIADVPYPTGAWVLANQDGGSCDTIIDTSGTTAMLTSSDCGAVSLTSALNDAGVMVITNQGLDVGPGARLHFIGTRPVQLVVIGNATIRGLVSVAPLLAAPQVPAGTNPSSCNAVAGIASRAGGGGGGFGGTGGNGGQSGGSGGSASSSVTPLRGGCPGAAGYRSGSMIPGGTGGGALQLIVADSLTMNGGTVAAAGGGGVQGTADTEGGGGGGSGGMVIIEARMIDLNGGAVTANGGGGGEGGDSGGTSAPGAPGPLRSVSAAPAANTASGGVGGVGGDNGAPNAGNGGGAGNPRGGGGGGGSAGVVFIRGATSCARGNGIISGSRPMTLSCP